MKNLKLNTSCLLDEFKEHSNENDTLVSLIKDAKSEILNTTNEYYGDKIHRVDRNDNLNY